MSPAQPGIETVISNEDLWYLRLGARLGVYRADLTHTTVKGNVLAVPRREVAYWRARLAELKAGTLEHGPARGLLLHESVHCRQMSRWPFWLFGLRYVLSRRFRRRIEEEAYTVHLTYLGECGIPLHASHWIGLLRQLYGRAFSVRKARETFDRIAAAVRAKVPNARVVEEPAGVSRDAPWLAEGEVPSR
jgi:hypothetical protein